MNKILVFGDSIAYGKWDQEGGWVARLRKDIDVSQNIGKGGNLQIYNLGIPGEVMPRLAERFEQELRYRINAKEENLVIIAAGINDSCPNNWMTEKLTPADTFKDSFKKIIDIGAKQGCRVLVVGLAPVNKERSKGLLFTNERAEEYDSYLSEVCHAMAVPKIDIFQSLLKRGFPSLLVDSVHPNEEGHMIIFEAIKSSLLKEVLL